MSEIATMKLCFWQSSKKHIDDMRGMPCNEYRKCAILGRVKITVIR